MELTEKQLKQAVKRYNGIMSGIYREELLVNETAAIEVMVDNARNVLDTYFEPGHMNCDLRYECRSSWVSETGKLKRFIAKYGDL